MSSENPPDVMRVQELWFDDADVIFQAGHKQFRVHRGILSARSSVFRDMFSVPQPATVLSENPQGCGLIQLADSPDDVHYFFLAIFDSSFFEAPPYPTSVEILRAILLLSHKYDVDYLLRRAVQHLNVLFPIDLIDFCRTHPFPCTNTLNLHDKEVRLSLLSLIEPVYTVSVHWILPALFFWTIHTGLETIFQSPHWKELPVQYQQKYLLYREGAVQDGIKRPNNISSLQIPMKDCLDPEKCATSIYSLKLNRVPRFAENVMWIEDTQHYRALAQDFCAACMEPLVCLYHCTVGQFFRISAYRLGLNWTTMCAEKSDFDRKQS